MFSQTYKLIMIVVLWTASFFLILAAGLFPGDDLLLCAWSLYVALGASVYTLWYFGIHQTQRVEQRIEECVEQPLERVEAMIGAFVVSLENARSARDDEDGIDHIH